LLVSYEKSEQSTDVINKADILLQELSQLKLSKDELERLKKMQKKYQQIAGI